MNTSSRDHLKDILKRFSVRQGLPGQVKLASGRTANGTSMESSQHVGLKPCR